MVFTGVYSCKTMLSRDGLWAVSDHAIQKETKVVRSGNGSMVPVKGKSIWQMLSNALFVSKTLRL